MNKVRVIDGIPIEMGSGNVYADLGYPDSEAMLVKSRLVAKIAEIIRNRGLTQVQAAAKLGMTQPKVSALLRGRFCGISEQKLLECLTRLGRDIQIVVMPAVKNRDTGRLTIRIA
jgi:predicted XRE-type DNA-binding protein